MSEIFLFNRNVWIAVTLSEWTDSIYVEDVPHTLYVHQAQHVAVTNALRHGGDFLLSVANAMGDGWNRPSPYFKGANETGVWGNDAIPVGKQRGDTHMARVGSRHLVLFLELVVNEFHEIIGVVTPHGFVLP